MPTEQNIKEAFEQFRLTDTSDSSNFQDFRAGYLALLNSPELEQCRKDAERYRWLRDTDGSGYLWVSNCTDDHLDAAIDKAMESV